MKKRILYLFSDTGGGHRASTNALIRAVSKLKPDYEQKMVDVFAECSSFLNIFAKMYAPVIRFAPKLWGKLWYMLDDMNKLRRLEKMTRPFVMKELKKLIVTEKPDLIVSVHPLLNHLTTQAMRDLKHHTPMITVITDPVTFHRSWVDEEVDEIVVATEEAKRRTIGFGMPKERIKLLGLPIDPRFALKDEEKRKIRFRLHHEQKLFTLLLMGGGEGGGKMYDIIKALSDAGLKIQAIVICGRNKRLEEKLNKIAPKLNFPLKVYGFTNEVPSLMSESDLLITKAGPGTIAEALAMNLPMIITSWLPGQEEGNVDFVRSHGVGRVSEDPLEIASMVKELKENKKEFDQIKKNIAKVSMPHSAFDIAKLIISHAERPRN
jgi:1,2-diacylglycerol 3-beta-galactosyltransferase